MDTIECIKALIETVDAGGFSGAARRLNVVPSVVMKRVNFLEHTIKQQLLHRSTRSVRLTEEGLRHITDLRQAVAQFETVLQGMKRAEQAPGGHLRIGAPPAITALHFSRLLGEFAQSYPQISIDLTLLDRAVNPLNAGFDVVLSGSTGTFSDVHDIPLFRLRRIVCGSPDYLHRMGEPTRPNDLYSHRLLALKPSTIIWEFRGPKGPIRIEHAPVMLSNDSLVLAASAIQGNGLAMLPAYVCAPEIQAGRLVEVLVDYPIAEMWFKAFVPDKQFNTLPVRTFMAWIQSALSPAPPWERG
ncbi:LysR family transcriptional regulator [Parapusillimonas granuli]|uniref:LysR family transcriptional regulator n=1 Tax=Parapusillimonas granuli TaxID=380911 RepID=A0A853G298_9BURK|nr:LysR family transcriptional regulator [Parapusillimonas granuli]MBB5214691.1 DNA-binding transcriptional LysR family regulator [Parapusillimonas granuli]MEB2398061.1 LysR family transcriptional regulator [Alcaligenaceae bacterium]NYT48901.1 LysR family transcriptional regulator [Parapusillimonas granuli]